MNVSPFVLSSTGHLILSKAYKFRVNMSKVQRFPIFPIVNQWRKVYCLLAVTAERGCPRDLKYYSVIKIFICTAAALFTTTSGNIEFRWNGIARQSHFAVIVLQFGANSSSQRVFYLWNHHLIYTVFVYCNLLTSGFLLHIAFFYFTRHNCHNIVWQCSFTYVKCYYACILCPISFVKFTLILGKEILRSELQVKPL